MAKKIVQKSKEGPSWKKIVPLLAIFFSLLFIFFIVIGGVLEEEEVLQKETKAAPTVELKPVSVQEQTLATANSTTEILLLQTMEIFPPLIVLLVILSMLGSFLMRIFR